MLQDGLCEQRQGAALPLHTADSSCLHNTEPPPKLVASGAPMLKQMNITQWTAICRQAMPVKTFPDRPEACGRAHAETDFPVQVCSTGRTHAGAVCSEGL